MSLQYNQTIKLSGELYCLASLFLWGDGTCEKPQVCKRVKILVHSCWLHQINTHTFEKVKHISTPETVPLILVHRSRENGSHIHGELDFKIISRMVLERPYYSDAVVLRFRINTSTQGGIPDFFLGGGALVSCSTSTPMNHIVFFCRIPVVLD